MPSSTSEPDRVREVAKQTMSNHREGVTLLRQAANQANAELYMFHESTTTDRAIQFRLLALTQTVNAAWKIVEHIEGGYPRLGLALARLLREGHIAYLWSIKNASLVHAQMEALLNNPSLERGPWPDSGEMAKEVFAGLVAEGSAKAGDWNSLVRTLGDTHNQLFSHTVSNFSLTTALDLADGRFTPAVGPTYNRPLVELAIDHCMPLYHLMLSDTSNLVALNFKRRVSPEAARLLKRCLAWWEAHPPAVLRKMGSLDQASGQGPQA